MSRDDCPFSQKCSTRAGPALEAPSQQAFARSTDAESYAAASLLVYTAPGSLAARLSVPYYYYATSALISILFMSISRGRAPTVQRPTKAHLLHLDLSGIRSSTHASRSWTLTTDYGRRER